MGKCRICGYEWIQRKESKACPRCKRYDWKNNIVLIKKEVSE